MIDDDCGGGVACAVIIVIMDYIRRFEILFFIFGNRKFVSCLINIIIVSYSIIQGTLFFFSNGDWD